MGQRKGQSGGGGIGGGFAGGDGGKLSSGSNAGKVGGRGGVGDPTKAPGTIAQLRNPPGGRDARIMLIALFLDRVGSGAWSSAAGLYFTVVAHFAAGQI